MTKDCVKRIVEQSNGAFSRDEARELLDQVDYDAKKKVQAGFEYEDAVSESLSQYSVTKLERQRQDKLDLLRDLKVQKSLEARVEDFISQSLSPREAWRTELVGTTSNVKRGRDSVEGKIQAIEEMHLAKITNQLEKENLLKVLNSKTLTKEITNELWDISHGNPGGVSGSDAALRIAQVIHSVQEVMRVRLNRAGARIGKTEGFSVSQGHNPARMKKMGRQAWKEMIRPLLNESKSFNNKARDFDKALDGAYEAIITGIRGNVQPSNLAKRLSSQRVLVFKDADSFLKYNSEFGTADFNDSIIRSIGSNARNIGLMERFGRDPRATIAKAMHTIEMKHRADIMESKDWGSYKGASEKYINQVVGFNNDDFNPTIANIGSNIRLFENVRRLGKVVITSLNDHLTQALEYQYQGKNILSSHAQPFIDKLSFFQTREEKVEYASMTLCGLETLIGDMGGSSGSNSNFSDTSSKLSRLWFKLNFLTPWTNTGKRAMGRMMAHHLGLNKGKVFSELHVDTKRNLSQYGITESDWDIMRNSTRKMDDGRDYVFPEDIADVTIAEKLGNYYLDRTNFGTLTPGAKEEALISLNTQKGTPVGEAVALIAQYKKYPTTVITKLWGRALYSKGKADIPAMIQLSIMGAAYGYLAIAAEAVMSGKEPPDPTKPGVIAASVLKGGAYGPYGDVALSDTSAMRSFADIVAGPFVGGTLTDLHSIFSGAVRGQDKKAAALKATVGMVPGNNHFLLQPAANYLLLYHILEELNPGYLRRMEKRMREKSGQEFILSPRDYSLID